MSNSIAWSGIANINAIDVSQSRFADIKRDWFTAKSIRRLSWTLLTYMYIGYIQVDLTISI